MPPASDRSKCSPALMWPLPKAKAKPLRLPTANWTPCTYAPRTHGFMSIALKWQLSKNFCNPANLPRDSYHGLAELLPAFVSNRLRLTLFAGPGYVAPLPFKTDDFKTCASQLIAQMNAEFAAGKIGQAANLVNRFVTWAAGDDDFYEFLIASHGFTRPEIFAAPAKAMFPSPAASGNQWS